MSPHVFEEISSLILMIFLQLFPTVYACFGGPYKLKFDNFMFKYTELTLMSFLVLMLICSDETMWTEWLSLTVCSLLFINSLLMPFLLMSDVTIFLVQFIRKRQREKRLKAQVKPEVEIKQIQNPSLNMTYLTTLALGDQRRGDYTEDSKMNVTLEDIDTFKRKGRAVKEL